MAYATSQVVNRLLGRDQFGTPSLWSVAQKTQVARGAGLVPSEVSVEWTNNINKVFGLQDERERLFPCYFCSLFLTFE